MRNEDEKVRVFAGTGSGWVTLIKIVSMLITASFAVIGGVISDNMGLSTVLGAIIGLGIGLFSIASTMILLNAAENIEQTTTNTAAQYERIKQIHIDVMKMHMILKNIDEQSRK